MPPGRSTRATRLRELPGLGQVEDDAVHRLLVAEPFLDRAQPHGEVGHLAHAHVDVGQRAARELVALLVGDHPALGAHRAQQRQGQRAGAGAGLEHATARVDVGPEQDHRQVLGVDDLGAARHLQHELGQRGPQGQVAQPHRGAHPRAVGLADDGVVRDPAAVGVEGLRLAQEDQVALAALIDEQDLLTVLEGEAARSRGGCRAARAGSASATNADQRHQRADPERASARPSGRRPSRARSRRAPPRPMAKPTMRPDAMPALRGR